MRRTLFVTFSFLAATVMALPQPAQGQTTSAPETLRLTVEDAVKMALDNNLDLNADRLDPQISDTQVAAAAGAYTPTFNTGLNSNNQLQPPSSFLIPSATRTDVITSTAGLSQRLPWFGTSYSLSWNATHTNSNSFLNSYNPLVQSGLNITASQPLLRDLQFDAARQQLATSRTNRDIADTRLRESVVHTTANVRSVYWNLVSAVATVDARKSALELAQELERVNKAKVDVGTSPPLDLVSAQAEVASDQEQLIIAETAVKQDEDALRVLIFDSSVRTNWNVKIEAIDSPPVATPTLDIDAAVTRALSERADLQRARKDIENAQTSVKFANNQRLPDVRLTAQYQTNGLGGTQVLRTGGFPGQIVGPGDVTPFSSVLNQLFNASYPTWLVGVNVSYPVGQSIEQANYARTRLEQSQSVERLKGDQARAIQQIRDAGWKVEMNTKRIDTTRAARELAEQRLDAERKRYEVGMSTSFLVIQAQRDLAQAKVNELSAILSYDLSLVDFEALQLAGPATQSSSSPTTSVGGQQPSTSGLATATQSTGVTSSSTGSGLPGSTSTTTTTPTVTGLPPIPQRQ
ncbi:MAG TPA: TolC family protein [Vicinamibacterales bacterium]|jgi:outer membrane protein|nr:TolC family protein [Vicinamibacterales bacterium]